MVRRGEPRRRRRRFKGTRNLDDMRFFSRMKNRDGAGLRSRRGQKKGARGHDGEVGILAAGHGARRHAHVVAAARAVITIHWGRVLRWSSGLLVMMMLGNRAVVAGAAIHNAGQQGGSGERGVEKCNGQQAEAC